MTQPDGECEISTDAKRSRCPIICSGPGLSIIRDFARRGAADYNVNVFTKTFITASAIVLCAHLAFASDKQVAAEATPTPSPPAPLMYLLDQAGLG